MAPLKIVEPKDPLPPDAATVEILRKGGWGEDATWLAPICCKAFESDDLVRSDSLGQCATHNTERVADIRAEMSDRNDALFAAFVYLSRWMDGLPGSKRPLWRTLPSLGENDLRPDPAAPDWLRSVAQEFQGNGLALESAALKAGWLPAFGSVEEIGKYLGYFAQLVGSQRQEMRLLAGHGVVRYLRGLVHVAGLRIDRIVDLQSPRSAATTSTTADSGDSATARVGIEASPLTDLRRLDPWLAVLSSDALTAVRPAVMEIGDSEATERAVSEVCASVQRWLRVSGLSFMSHLGELGPPFAQALAPYLALFVERCGERASASDKRSASRQTWVRLAAFVGEADTESKKLVADEVVSASLRIATEEFAALRKVLAQAKHDPEVVVEVQVAEKVDATGMRADPTTGVPISASARATFEAEREHYSAANRLLCRWGGYWRALKPMLLAWRALPVPGVPRDLRWWVEPPLEAPPRPWVDLFMWPIGLLHSQAHLEEATDPELKQIRSDFAEFCLERITDRLSDDRREALEADGAVRTDDDMVERSPAWRYCLIRAAASLGANPEGRGHRALKFSAQHDPSEEVRSAAKDAFERIRRGVGLPEGVSPRRAVISALWWLRQAHLLGLEIQPDADGAQRTRVKELSRTKEDERAARLAANQDT